MNPDIKELYIKVLKHNWIVKPHGYSKNQYITACRFNYPGEEHNIRIITLDEN